MRDRDVRRALLSHLTALHAGDDDTRIIEEMGVWSGSARIDVAVINGELVGFELKSDRDTLERLRQQAEIYNLVFDRMYLVTAERHARKAEDIIPEWWGTFLAHSCGEDTEIAPFRPATPNPARDPHILVQLLWRDEAVALLEAHDIAGGYRSKRARVIHQRLAEELSLEDLSEGVRAALKARTEWLGKVEPDPFDMTVHTDSHPSL